MQAAMYNFTGNFSFSELFEIVPTTSLRSSQSMEVTAIRNIAPIVLLNPCLSLLESEENIKLDANPPLSHKLRRTQKGSDVSRNGP